MPIQSVTPKFAKWGLAPPLWFSLWNSNNQWPDNKSYPFGTTYYPSSAGVTKTAFPLFTGLFSPHNILTPSKSTASVQAYVYWTPSTASNLTAPSNRTYVMWGAELYNFTVGSPVWSLIGNYSGFYNLPTVYQDSTGTVPSSRVSAALANGSFSFANSPSAILQQSFANMYIPQIAVSWHKFNAGDNMSAVFKDPLYFIYNNPVNGVVTVSNQFTFTNFAASAPGVSYNSGTNLLLDIGPQPTAMGMLLYRLNAGYPSTGVFGSGFDFDGDGLNEQDNYNNQVIFLGMEADIL
jgi:hypothetical protein